MRLRSFKRVSRLFRTRRKTASLPRYLVRRPRAGENLKASMLARYPVEPQKWAFLIVYLALAAISNWAVLSYIHDFVPSGALPDVVFMLVPEQEWASFMADYMVSICVSCAVCLLFFHEGRLIVARRTVFIIATLYSMRSVTLMITQLPPGYENNSIRCQQQLNTTRSIFLIRLQRQIIKLGFQEKIGMLCGDLLFSGHTLLMVSCCMSIAYYLPKRYKWLQWFPITCACFGAVCLIISRTHYSTDVVIAYWLSTYVFRIYHAYVEADICIVREDSVLHGIWWIRLVDWLEENIIPGRIQNTFQVPLVDTVIHRYTSSIPHEKFVDEEISKRNSTLTLA